MNLRHWLFSAVATAAVFSSVEAIVIDHDKVQPFPQPNPVTLTEKVAIKYKPSLEIVAGCHPYPAVNAAGDTNGGLKGTGKANGKCTGSPLGSQVYGRSGWYKDMWAIMYAWYFPKDMVYRHKWSAAVVWLDNPAFKKPKILAVSTIGIGGVYEITKNGSPKCGRRWCDPPFVEYINDTSPMLAYGPGNEASGIELTTVRGQGEFQNLIMWDQLTEEARAGLSNADFAPPFIEEAFKPNLESARPFF